MPKRPEVETVRGRLSDERAEQILAFWSAHGALAGDAARTRLAEVVCTLVDAAGGVRGVNSVFETKVPVIGDRPFWIYRRFLAPGADDDPAPDSDDADTSMLMAAFDALAAERRDPGSGPLGLCLVVDDPGLVRRRPEAVWPGTGFFHAGSLPQGQQLRIRYFDGVDIV